MDIKYTTEQISQIKREISEKIKHTLELEKAAGEGNVAAMLEMAYYYQSGVGGCNDKMHNSKAACWLRRAADGGDLAAMRSYGELLESREKDYTQAAYWYEKAISAGDEYAKVLLSRCYREGKGVGKDAEKAMNLLHQALASGDRRTAAGAASDMAQMHAGYKDAAAWFKIVVRLGYTGMGYWRLAKLAGNAGDALLSAYYAAKADSECLGNDCLKLFFLNYILGFRDSVFIEEEYIALLEDTPQAEYEIGKIFAAKGHVEAAADFWQNVANTGDEEAAVALRKIRPQVYENICELIKFAEDNGCSLAADKFKQEAVALTDVNEE